MNGFRVVVVDDEPLARQMVAALVRRDAEVEQVVECASPAAFQDALATHQPHIAFLDVEMPGVDGLTAARTIAAERICAVLMLTAFSQREIIEEARDAGALAYLVKPFQKNDLIPAIEVAIGRFRELAALDGEVDALGEQLESRKLIDRAKGLLMDQFGYKEQDAFTFIQRTAMSERCRMRDVAERILAGTLHP